MKINAQPLAAMVLRTLLLAVALLAPSLLAQTIPNPGFETNGLANWTATGTVSVVTAGAVADNGVIPQGTHVAALSCPEPRTQAKLSTTISGLVVGGHYGVSCRVNAQDSLAPVGAALSVQGSAIALQNQPPVGVGNPYAVLSGSFTAASTTATLEVSANSLLNAGTLLVDDFRIVRTEVLNADDSGPGSLRQALLDAAAVPGPNTITFDPSLAGQTISLTTSSDGIAITSNDAHGVTVDATGVPGIVINDGTATTYGLLFMSGTGPVTLRGLTFANGGGAGFAGLGGAIYKSGAPLVVERCVFSGNSVNGGGVSGGAIAVFGHLTLTQCTFTGNSANGANAAGGAVTLISGTLTATNCTFTGNSVTGTNAKGGAIYVTNLASLTHCTVSGNTASGEGASVGGIFNGGDNDTELTNTIVAGNTAPTGAFTSGAFTGSGNVIDVNPKLAPLADNGGPTPTMALLPGSPALDKGEVLDPVLALDQRGFARNLNGDAVAGALPDIGAYEAQAVPLAGIGFNFAGGIENEPASPGGIMAAVDLAGVFPQANWNNLTNANDGAPHDGRATNAQSRRDANGTTIAGLKLWWASPNVWAVNSTVPGSANRKLMNGYLDSIDTGDGSTAPDLYASNTAQPFFSVAGLPGSLTSGGYRVLVYADGGSTDGAKASYWLNSNDGQNPASAGGERRLTPSVFLSDTANFSGTYSRATGTSVNTATAGANYVQFDGLAETAFTVRAEEHDFRAPINAVQIVPNERIAVTTAADENDPNGTLGTGISLREALRDAPDGACIVFDAALSGQFIHLRSGLADIVLGKNVTIDASNLSGGVTITRDVTGVFRLFTVLPGKTVTLVGLTLTGGRGGGQDLATTGGAIKNGGTLSLTNCTLSANSAAFNNGFANSGTGGAIHNIGTLTLTGCTFAFNVTTKTAAAIDVPISDASASGGAIYNSAGGSLTATNCTFTGNSSINEGGAIASLGALTITHCTLTGNIAKSGGAIFVETGGVTVLRRCTLTRNTASNGYGGAIYAQGPVSLTQCTVAGNTAVGTSANNGYGGGIFSDPGALTLNHCTIAGNTASGFGGTAFGGGVFVNASATGGYAIANSIIANNTAATGGPDLLENGFTPETPFAFTGGILLGSNNGNGFRAGGGVIIGDPRLAPLGDFGGTTATMALLPGSPARNKATGSARFGTALPSGFPTDQRGFPSPVGISADLGAYEAGTLTRNYNAYIYESLPVTNSFAWNAAIPAAQYAGTADFDGDGSSNSNEWTLGSRAESGTVGGDPVVERSGDDFVLRVPTILHRIYTIQRLSPTFTWENQGAAFAGDGSVKLITVPVDGATGIYRVAVTAAP